MTVCATCACDTAPKEVKLNMTDRKTLASCDGTSYNERWKKKNLLRRFYLWYLASFMRAFIFFLVPCLAAEKKKARAAIKYKNVNIQWRQFNKQIIFEKSILRFKSRVYSIMQWCFFSHWFRIICPSFMHQLHRESDALSQIQCKNRFFS